MRILALAVLAAGTLLAHAVGAAQTYDPSYPVCLHVWGRGATYYECRYSSLAQCNASASGRAAQCVVNPVLSRMHMRIGRCDTTASAAPTEP